MTARANFKENPQHSVISQAQAGSFITASQNQNNFPT